MTCQVTAVLPVVRTRFGGCICIYEPFIGSGIRKDFPAHEDEESLPRASRPVPGISHLAAAPSGAERTAIGWWRLPARGLLR